MLNVGLTGGIASGKTYVVELLRGYGCEVTDADIVARKVVEPGQPAYTDIVQTFGQEILQADGALDRRKLGAIVFADEKARQQLNAIVHPRVHQAQIHWLNEIAARNPDAITITDAALMIEAGSFTRFDKIVVVFCAPEIQLARLMQRNNLTESEANQRIAAQMPTNEKLKYADYTIDTSAGFESTQQQVAVLFSELQKQAALNAGKS